MRTALERKDGSARTAASSALWRPLRVPIFRKLLVADVLSDIGTFMQSVGAAWLMVSFGVGPMFLALTQTASSLPFFVLALPAGSIGDIVDRRKLILVTEAWMVSVAVLLAALTMLGLMSPWLLLALTFAISAGDAIETPTWRAILPELVSRDNLASASALNGIEFNLARAVGPALAGALIAVAGVGPAFAVNALSFVGVIVVVAGDSRAMAALGVVLLVGGSAWIIFISLVSALVQSLAPDWVRARVLAMFMLVFQGGLAAGSALWGAIGERAGIETALLYAGFGTAVTAALGLAWWVPDGPADVCPWNHWRMPTLVGDVGPALEG